MTIPDWWRKPRNISVVVDNPSWVLPWAERLMELMNSDGDRARICRKHDDIDDGAVAFFLGCILITPPEVLARKYRNLVVHASPLPRGRGFSPLTWQVIEGLNEIPVCLLHAAEEVDSGAIVLGERLQFGGHELIEEMRRTLGDATVRLCRQYLQFEIPPVGRAQTGEPTVYPRRRPPDSRLDPQKTLAEQFDLLRTVDNGAYPAFFHLRGHWYKLRIEKMPAPEGCA